MSVVRFDDAANVVAQFLKSFSTQPGLEELVAIRDLGGVYRFAIRGDAKTAVPALEAALVGLEASLGNWLADESRRATHGKPSLYGRVITAAQLFDAAAVFGSPDRVPVTGNTALLDRRVVAGDWQRGPLARATDGPPRATFFAIKGGTGRSTALLYWARHLAVDLGKRVLVVDLDLEAPGVSASLLGSGAGPLSGVVDWYVEDARGQANADLIEQMVAVSPIAQGGLGNIVVAPVAGDSGDYLAKLARVYAAPPGSGDGGGFGDRTARMIAALESHVQPDVTLIDSRAGLHDVGAVSLVRLGATSFLFASPTEECWLGYQLMFRSWGKRRQLVSAFRDNLQVVASLVPEEGAQAYVERVRESAHNLFQEWIYDQEDDTDSQEPFNFSLDAPDAPHTPIPVLWNRRFFAHVPRHALDDDSHRKGVEANFGQFFNRAGELVLR